MMSGRPSAAIWSVVLVHALTMGLKRGRNRTLHRVVVLHQDTKQIHHHQLRRFRTASHCIVRHGAKHRTSPQSGSHQNVQVR